MTPIQAHPSAYDDGAILVLRGLEAIRSRDGMSGERRSVDEIALEELNEQAYLSYAMMVICERALPDSLRRNTLAGAKFALVLFLLTLLLPLIYLAIKRRNTALARRASRAINRVPLFEYGPELSEYRHRHR